MTHIKNRKIMVFLKKYKIAIILILLIAIIGIRIITKPETVASGNGYSHQVGEFGECDIRMDGCTIDATHRRHDFFTGNEDYCEYCWDNYGKGIFNRLSKMKSDDIIEKTCAWCNGTGYNRNGAQTVEEYVFKKTPCKLCDGKGTF